MQVYLRAETPLHVTTFNVLQSVALFILLMALLVTFLSRSVFRVKTWFYLLISFAIYCVSFLLLAGHQTGPVPPLGLCLIQAGLIYAAPPLVALAALIFMVELYFRLTAVTLARNFESRPFLMAHTLPLVHAVVFWVALLSGLSDLKTVKRESNGLYCHIEQRIPTTFTSVLVILFCGSTIMFEVCTAIHLFRAHFSGKYISVLQAGFPLNLFIRTTAFTILGGLAIVFVVIMNRGPPTEFKSNVLTVLPFSVAVLFGLQTDILRSLMFWGRENPNTTPRSALPV